MTIKNHKKLKGKSKGKVRQFSAANQNCCYVPEKPAPTLVAAQRGTPVSEVPGYYRISPNAETKRSLEKTDLTNCTKRLVDLFLSSFFERQNHIVLTWPCKMETASLVYRFATVDLLRYSTIKNLTAFIFPWKDGFQDSPSRQLLVCRNTIQEIVRPRMTRHAKLGHLSDPSNMEYAYDRLMFRLADAGEETIRIKGKSRAITTPKEFRHPSLFEMLPGFAPDNLGRYQVFDKLLYRVKDYTQMYEGDTAADSIPVVAQPQNAPFAVFGFRGTSQKATKACLEQKVFASRSPDVMLIDLGFEARRTLGPRWLKCIIAFLLETKEQYGQVPPSLFITDDPFTYHTVSEELSSATKVKKLPVPDFTFKSTCIFNPDKLATISGKRPELEFTLPHFVVSSKDKRMYDLQIAASRLAKALEVNGLDSAAKTIRQTMSFLKRISNLPCCTQLAHVMIRQDHPEEVPVNISNRYWPTKVYADLAAAAQSAPGFQKEIEAFQEVFIARLKELEIDTPVRLALNRMLASQTKEDTYTLLVMPSAESRVMAQKLVDREDDYLMMEKEKRRIDTVDPKGEVLYIDRRHLNGSLDRLVTEEKLQQVILVQPKPEDIADLLIKEKLPKKVVIIADYSTATLIAANLRIIVRCLGLEVVHQRAKKLLEALDIAADSAVGLIANELEANYDDIPAVFDTTKGEDGNGGGVHGSKLVIQGVDGRGLIVREHSEILLYTGDILNPFRRTQACDLAVGHQIVIFTDDFLEECREALRNSPHTSFVLGQYHTMVNAKKNGLPGSSLTEKSNYILQKMHEIDPKMSEKGIDNIKRWLSVGRFIDQPTEIVTPQAPRRLREYKAFMKSLNIDESRSRQYWDEGIYLTRSWRIRDGQMFHRAYSDFLLDPDMAQATNRIGAEDCQRLLLMAMDLVTTVSGIDEN